VERAVILGTGETFSIDRSWLQPEARKTSNPPALSVALGNQEKAMIESALAECSGRIAGSSGAAGKLGIPRSTLESKIKRLRIDKHRFKCLAAASTARTASS
jgi:formate hydrogenlyase transcriptional activator